MGRAGSVRAEIAWTEEGGVETTVGPGGSTSTRAELEGEEDGEFVDSLFRSLPKFLLGERAFGSSLFLTCGNSTTVIMSAISLVSSGMIGGGESGRFGGGESGKVGGGKSGKLDIDSAEFLKLFSSTVC